MHCAATATAHVNQPPFLRSRRQGIAELFWGWPILAIVRDANRLVLVLVLSAAVLVLVIDRSPASTHVARRAHSSVE